jgi:hypothetical protein
MSKGLVVAVAVLGGVAALVARELPGIRRYKKIAAM